MSEPRKAKFQRLGQDLESVAAEIEVQFNPTELAFSKSIQIAEVPIPGLDSPILQFVRGQTETLTLELFFDTTEDGMSGAFATPVTWKTDQFYQLLKINKHSHAPPVCRFVLGGEGFPGSKLTGDEAGQRRLDFKCVVERVEQRFTLFSPEGTPLRATLTVALKEFKTIAEQVAQIDFQSPTFTKTRVVQRGETLGLLAYEAYGAPGAWRLIAEANDVDDPLAVEAGAVLTIPPAAP